MRRLVRAHAVGGYRRRSLPRVSSRFLTASTVSSGYANPGRLGLRRWPVRTSRSGSSLFARPDGSRTGSLGARGLLQEVAKPFELPLHALSRLTGAKRLEHLRQPTASRTNRERKHRPVSDGLELVDASRSAGFRNEADPPIGLVLSDLEDLLDSLAAGAQYLPVSRSDCLARRRNPFDFVNEAGLPARFVLEVGDEGEDVLRRSPDEHATLRRRHLRWPRSGGGVRRRPGGPSHGRHVPCAAPAARCAP